MIHKTHTRHHDVGKMEKNSLRMDASYPYMNQSADRIDLEAGDILDDRLDMRPTRACDMSKCLSNCTNNCLLLLCLSSRGTKF